MDNTSVDDVCRAIQVHFSNESLRIAREKLASSCKKWLDGTEIISVQFRRGSTARPAIEMNASDVANGVYKIMTSSDAPRFATLNLSMLPIVRPTEGNDRETDERLHILEKRLSLLERRQEDDRETLSENTTEILRNTENAKRLKSVVDSILESPVMRNPRMPSDDRDNTYSPDNEVFPDLPKKAAVNTGPTPWKSPVPNVASNLPLTTNVNGACEQTDMPRINDKSDNSCDTTASDGFVKTNKQIRKEARENKRKAIVLQGTVKNTGIKPGRAPDRDLWIFNVDKETDDNELRSYIAEGGNAKSKPIGIRKWEPQYKEEFYTKCFRLTISKDDYETVFNADFWPDSIKIRKYWVNRSKRGNAQSGGGGNEEA